MKGSPALRELHRWKNIVIKLYVTGQTPRAQAAIDNLRRICEQELGGRYELAVIDVLQRPQLAEDEKILATPTVVKELPAPIRRIIGDLSDSERVLLGLDLRPRRSRRTGGEWARDDHAGIRRVRSPSSAPPSRAST